MRTSWTQPVLGPWQLGSYLFKTFCQVRTRCIKFQFDIPTTRHDITTSEFAFLSCGVGVSMRLDSGVALRLHINEHICQILYNRLVLLAGQGYQHINLLLLCCVQLSAFTCKILAPFFSDRYS